MHVTRILVPTGAARGRGGRPPKLGSQKNSWLRRCGQIIIFSEEYFKVALSIPYIDGLLAQIKDRF